MWTELEAVPLIKPTQAVQPDTITRKLKSFQLEGLDWMMKQEKSQWKGGLLGDEMGMGKTIQAVSLIMSDYPAKDPTLVVVVSYRRSCSAQHKSSSSTDLSPPCRVPTKNRCLRLVSNDHLPLPPLLC